MKLQKESDDQYHYTRLWKQTSFRTNEKLFSNAFIKEFLQSIASVNSIIYVSFSAPHKLNVVLKDVIHWPFVWRETQTLRKLILH